MIINEVIGVTEGGSTPSIVFKSLLLAKLNRPTLVCSPRDIFVVFWKRSSWFCKLSWRIWHWPHGDKYWPFHIKNEFALYGEMIQV